MAEPPGRAARPEAGSSVAPVVMTTGAPCVRGLGTTIAPRRRATFRQTLLRIRTPSALAARPTARLAVVFSWSRIGFTSTSSRQSSTPASATSSSARCASRYDRPPRTGSPTPGANSGSTTSRSTETWTNKRTRDTSKGLLDHRESVTRPSIVTSLATVVPDLGLVKLTTGGVVSSVNENSAMGERFPTTRSPAVKADRVDPVGGVVELEGRAEGEVPQVLEGDRDRDAAVDRPQERGHPGEVVRDPAVDRRIGVLFEKAPGVGEMSWIFGARRVQEDPEPGRSAADRTRRRPGPGGGWPPGRARRETTNVPEGSAVAEPSSNPPSLPLSSARPGTRPRRPGHESGRVARGQAARRQRHHALGRGRRRGRGGRDASRCRSSDAIACSRTTRSGRRGCCPRRSRSDRRPRPPRPGSGSCRRRRGRSHGRRWRRPPGTHPGGSPPMSRGRPRRPPGICLP